MSNALWLDNLEVISMTTKGDTKTVKAAKDSDIDVKALRKVAKELTMPSDKLAKRFDDEAQIDMFRDEVGLKVRKGLVELLEAAE